MNQIFFQRDRGTLGSHWLFFLVCFALGQFPNRSLAQISPGGPADTSSPAATLSSFIDSSNELAGQISRRHYFDRSSVESRRLIWRLLDCLDVSGLPEFEREEMALESACSIKEILDRVELPPESSWPAGEETGRWRIPGTRLLIMRNEEGPRRFEYVFSKDTVDRSTDYYQEVQSLPYRTSEPAVSKGILNRYLSVPGHIGLAPAVRILPRWLRSPYYEIALWKWLGLIMGLFIGTALMVGGYRAQGLWSPRSDELTRGELLAYSLSILFPIGAMLIPVMLIEFCHNFLAFRSTPLYFVSFAGSVVAILASLPVIFGTSNRIVAIILALPQIDSRGFNAEIIRLSARGLAALTCLIVFLMGGQFLEIPLTTLLASAGVGGLAIALAAQDTLKTLFSTVALFMDRPFQVGERIIFGGYDGFVEKIGFRSTKVRLLAGHLVTIPNDELVSKNVENGGTQIRREADLHLPLDTPRKRMNEAVQGIREMLEGLEGLDPNQPSQVAFLDYKPSSYLIRFYYWYPSSHYWHYLEFSERVNTRVFEILDEAGVALALPDRVTYTDQASRAVPLTVKLSAELATQEPATQRSKRKPE